MIPKRASLENPSMHVRFLRQKLFRTPLFTNLLWRRRRKPAFKAGSVWWTKSSSFALKILSWVQNQSLFLMFMVTEWTKKSIWEEGKKQHTVSVSCEIGKVTKNNDNVTLTLSLVSKWTAKTQIGEFSTLGLLLWNFHYLFIVHVNSRELCLFVCLFVVHIGVHVGDLQWKYPRLTDDQHCCSKAEHSQEREKHHCSSM